MNPSHAGNNHLENRVFSARKTAFSGPWPRYAARKPGFLPLIAPVFPRHTRPIRPGVPRWRCPDLRCFARQKARDTGVSGGSPPSAPGFPGGPVQPARSVSGKAPWLCPCAGLRGSRRSGSRFPPRLPRPSARAAPPAPGVGSFRPPSRPDPQGGFHLWGRILKDRGPLSRKKSPNQTGY